MSERRRNGRKHYVRPSNRLRAEDWGCPECWADMRTEPDGRWRCLGCGATFTLVERDEGPTGTPAGPVIAQ